MAILRYIGLGKQTEFGTAVTPTQFIDVISESIKPEKEVVEYEVGTQREVIDKFIATWKYSGTIEMYAEPNQITDFLYGVFGDVTTISDGGSPEVAYKHEFVPGTSLPFYTIEVVPNLANKARRVDSCVVQKVEFSCVAKEIATLSVDVVGRSETLTAPTSPSISRTTPFIYHGGTVTVDDSTKSNVTSIKISVENEITDDLFTITDEPFIQDIPVHGVKVSGTMDIHVTDWEFYEYLLGAASATSPQKTMSPISISLALTGGSTGSSQSSFENYQLTIDLPKVYITDGPINFSKRERLAQSVSFEAVYDSSSGYVTKWTLINTRSEV